VRVSNQPKNEIGSIDLYEAALMPLPVMAEAERNPSNGQRIDEFMQAFIRGGRLSGSRVARPVG